MSNMSISTKSPDEVKQRKMSHIEQAVLDILVFNPHKHLLTIPAIYTPVLIRAS